ncbi:MAG: hypothetical protein H6R20_982 [Proteobacteria bacterium]|nr:hypothetical protein [Pseudomonadota bacterium]
MLRSAKLLASVASLFVVAAAPVAGQQVYKWVDETGRVHYSNSPPPSGAARGSVQSVAPKVSTMPAPTIDQDAARDRREQDLQRRVDQLEREQAAQQRAPATPSQSSAAAEAEAVRQWREQCRANRGTDCEGTPYYEPSYGSYYPYPPVVRPPVGNRPPRTGWRGGRLRPDAAGATAAAPCSDAVPRTAGAAAAIAARKFASITKKGRRGAPSLFDPPLDAPYRGSSELPIRNSSTARAHWRPSRIAQTTSDWPRRMSPAANTFGALVA